MNILIGNRWIPGFLDPHCSSSQYRIQVAGLHILSPIQGIYFERQTSLRMVWAYFLDLGPVAVLRKILSRREERLRNLKVISVGLGRVVTRPNDGKFELGEWVGFVCPVGPRCPERVVLGEYTLFSVDQSVVGALIDEVVRVVEDIPQYSVADRWWDPVVAYSPDSGVEIDDSIWEAIRRRAYEELRGLDWRTAFVTPHAPKSAIQEFAGERTIGKKAGIRSAVIFGYGQYVKSVVIPNIRGRLRVDTIHEVDPTQLPRSRRFGGVLDTSPFLRRGEVADVVFIAGWHHTHASIAMAALRAGAVAVVEKPIVIDAGQLEQLCTTLSETSGRLFCCYQRRYGLFNHLAYEDLGLRPGEPISYHCIVYQERLPPHHWYRWPRSRGRIISNGCHWIDHFLYLNSYDAVVGWTVMAVNDGAISCSIKLSNGALFTMALNDNGSSTKGMRDYVELRSRKATVKIIDSREYIAELPNGVSRRCRIGKMRTYEDMYRTIVTKILSGAPGDSVADLKAGQGLMIAMDDDLVRQANRGRDGSLPDERGGS
jgi:predicted dehydrogenase